jgi:hypothetical protein
LAVMVERPCAIGSESSGELASPLDASEASRRPRSGFHLLLLKAIAAHHPILVPALGVESTSIVLYC